MKVSFGIILATLSALAVFAPAKAAAQTTKPAKIQVAASLPDLASIAAYVGGDRVEAFSIAKSNANPHFVEVLPSYMIKVSRASVYVKAGLGLDGWAGAILDGSRNARILVVDASAGVAVLEKPSGKVDASHGDVHPHGNPHYWLDPENGIRIAETIRDALKKADPANAAMYEANAARFRAEASKRMQDWKARMAPLRGSAIVTYHSSWAYFAAAFGLKVVEHVEPYPGIPPTARHLREVADAMRAHDVKIVLQEPYYPGKDSEFLARRAGARVHRFTPACPGTEANAYLDHFETMVSALTEGGAP
jgi:zinc/manganese transport system substrate-binding protein